ncbi:MAG TPA: two-component regulator propeller domain-containing protein [Rhodocyclaceae bacterium]|nr:two-component regulator propeller domain-containing protein [Rhodocyclaceae bacterium]
MRFISLLAALVAVPVLAQAPHPAMPNHPPVPEPQREGKAVPDPKAKFTHFRVGNKNVKSIFIEGKRVWVGTSGGVVRYDTSNDGFKLFDTKSGLLSNGVFYVGRIKGKLTVGTYGGGFSQMVDETKEQWKTYNIPEGLGDAFVYGMLEAKNGDIWIATWSGVNRVRGGQLDDRSKWDLYTVENTKGGVPNDWIYGLAEGRNGDIWLATEGGMARFAKGKWENWNHAKGLGAPYEKVKNDIAFKNDPSKQSVHHAKQKEEMGLQGVDVAYNPNYVVSIAVDKDGLVWAGTWGGGVSRFDGRKWISYTTKEGLPGNHVFMLHKDEKGKLWIGTNNGLTTWEDGKFAKSMTTAEGLFANNIFAMSSTTDGDLWIGSYGGVAHLRPGK